jgi:hypothetical protein
MIAPSAPCCLCGLCPAFCVETACHRAHLRPLVSPPLVFCSVCMVLLCHTTYTRSCAVQSIQACCVPPELLLSSAVGQVLVSAVPPAALPVARTLVCHWHCCLSAYASLSPRLCELPLPQLFSWRRALCLVCCCPGLYSLCKPCEAAHCIVGVGTVCSNRVFIRLESTDSVPLQPRNVTRLAGWPHTLLHCIGVTVWLLWPAPLCHDSSVGACCLEVGQLVAESDRRLSQHHQRSAK